MCLAVPMKLIKIDGINGIVELGNINYKVNLELIDNPLIGEYLIVHAGFAINKINEAEAIESINLINQIKENSNA
ncbi:MAG: HypC/HybG/HupF family hydrogenase formation chaperone [Spirochaetes bacterium]|nr:HypC/HybG/HupF family hydrogenase formation chaperone [Spirochaetota bacterium]